MSKVFSLVLVIGLSLALPGCSLFPSGSDYVQPTAYDADIAESHAKATIACFEAEEAADKAAMGKLHDAKDVLLGLAIKGLSTAANGGKGKCGTRTNFYDAQIVLIRAGVDKYAKTMDTAKAIAGDAVTLGLGWKAFDTLGEMFKDSGTTTIGDHASISESFNSPKATSIGSGTIATAAPTTEVIEQPAPLVVETGNTTTSTVNTTTNNGVQ